MFYAAKVLDTRPGGLKLPEGQTEKEKRGRSLFYIIIILSAHREISAK